MPRCPVCSTTVDLAALPTPPFCSERCRLIDLGRWLDESYSMPARRPGPDGDDESDDDAPVDDDPDADES